MRTEYSPIVILTVVLVLGSAIAMSSISHPLMIYANHEFAANLTGQQEVPPVNTQATGEAIFVPELPLNKTVDFWVNATGIQGATGGHIHSGAKGQNGPVVVTLFKFDTPQNTVSNQWYYCCK